MAATNITTGPNVFHPEKPSAVGSRNSLNRNNRDEYSESQLLVDEEVDKILNHIHAKLPPEVLSRLEVTGNVKQLLHNYYNQSFQNMYNRYITTVEDELAKKFRTLVDKEEFSSLNRYTPKEITKLLSTVGGDEKFNTAENEKSIVNIYGHLQGHLQRGVYDLENATNSLLRQKTDVGAFVRGENTYAITKCSIMDSLDKPETVSDICLAINIQSNELISPIYHYQTLSSMILKELVSEKILDNIDAEIDAINDKLIDEGAEEMGAFVKISEKFKKVESYLTSKDGSEDGEDEASNKYSIVAKKIYDAIENAAGSDEATADDPSSVRQFAVSAIEKENVRNRGFNTALNSICNILDTSRMGYQHIENFKNARRAVIGEYRHKYRADNPDESFNIVLEYVDANQLKEKCIAYDQQIIDFQNEVDKLSKIVESVHKQFYVKEQGNQTYETFSDSILNPEISKSAFSKKEDDEVDEDEEEKLWNELTFISPAKGNAESEFPTYRHELDFLARKIDSLGLKIKQSFKNNFPDERIAVENRIDFLKQSVYDFVRLYNPYHSAAGLMISIDMRTIKRKLYTMKGMANVLNEFLHGLSKGFSDTAFASFSRRRSTDRTITDEDWKTLKTAKNSEGDELEGVAEI